MIKIKVFLLALTMVAMTTVAKAQTDGSVFSLYSQYGLGELSTLGTAASRGMGGIGVASRDMLMLNLLNPAAYNTTERQNALFSFGGEGTNNYLKSANGSNSKNFFNLGHIGLQFRISNKIGFGLVVAPYSSMGYELTRTEKNPDVVANIGNYKFDYTGSGGIAQLKTGIAYNAFKNFNIGVNYIYYLGSFKQNTTTTITQYIESNSYKNIYENQKSRINQSSFEIGAQYTIKLKEFNSINIGATFQPKMESKMERSRFIASGFTSDIILPNDVVTDSQYDETYYFPMRLAVGVSYNTQKINLELNSSYQDWKGSFPQNNISGLSYSSRQEVRAGIQYTPNRMDIRSHLKRWTYRAGLMYGTSYIVKNGFQSKDFSGSIGLGIPLEREWFSLLNFSAEVGRTGALKIGQVRNTFFKFNVGFTFASRNWFVRYKYL